MGVRRITMSTHLGIGRPIMANEAERTQLNALACALVEQEGISPTVVAPTGESVPLPENVTEFLTRVVHALAKGQAIQLVVFPRELAIFEVAALLGESEDTVEQLLAEGQLPLIGDEAHRRVRLDDAMIYMERRDAERWEALRRLTELNQELGLYSRR
jgi:hypothetical protein